MRALITGVILFAVLGCGGSDAVQSDEPIETLGEACTLIGKAACQRLGMCGQLAGATVDDCQSQFVTSCCVTAGACSNTATDTAAATKSIGKCTRDFNTWDCAALSRGNVPPTCLAAQKPIGLYDVAEH